MELDLAHRREHLFFRHRIGTFLLHEQGPAYADGTGGDQYHLCAVPFEFGDLLRQMCHHRSVNGAVVFRQHIRPDFCDYSFVHLYTIQNLGAIRQYKSFQRSGSDALIQDSW